MKRRTFITQSLSAAAGTFVLPRFAIGSAGPSANSRLNIAMIGAGNIAKMAYSGCENENIVALCDIDQSMIAGAKAEHAHLGGAREFADFRVMLDKMGREIDGVCINTPDHTHFVATIDAMQRGIHVCTQKPLTHNVWEARTLIKASRKYKVVTNMANQGHTYNGIREVREMYDAGLFGQITEVHLGFPGPNWGSQFFRKPEAFPIGAEAVPAGVNWNLWLGPVAKELPFNSIYHPLTWRGFYDFGTGQFGDWFCHIGDGPVWTLDLYAPTVVECVSRGDVLPGMIPDHSVVRFDFPARGGKAACSMYWYDGYGGNGGRDIKRPAEWDWQDQPRHGSFWYGEKENVYLDNRSNNPRFTTRSRMLEYRDFKKETGGLPEQFARVAGGPHQEWLRAIKGEGPEPGSNFEYSAPMSEIALLGVLAQRFGGRFEWNAAQGLSNREDINSCLKEPVRPGWEYGADLWSSSGRAGGPAEPGSLPSSQNPQPPLSPGKPPLRVRRRKS